MKAQLYTVPITAEDTAFGNLAGYPVFMFEQNENVSGFVVEDSIERMTRTICLFQPTANPDVLRHIKGNLAEQLEFHEIEALIEQAILNADAEIRGIRRNFLESIRDELRSQMESMAARPSLSDILTKRI